MAGGLIAPEDGYRERDAASEHRNRATAREARLRQLEYVYDALAERYDDLHGGAAAQSEDRWLARDLRDYVNGNVADIGCGDGMLLTLLSIPPERYIGIDLSEGMLRLAHQRWPDHRFIHGDMHDAVAYLPPGQVNTVVSLFTFSMADGPRLLAAIRDVLAPTGRVYFTVTTPLHGESDCPCQTYHPPGTDRFYTEPEARDLFNRYFDLVVARPLPSDGQAGHYLIVTGRGPKR